jgi:hypothetical protein
MTSPIIADELEYEDYLAELFEEGPAGTGTCLNADGTPNREIEAFLNGEPLQFSNPYARQKGGKFGFKSGASTGSGSTRPPGSDQPPAYLKSLAMAESFKGRHPGMETNQLEEFDPDTLKETVVETERLMKKYPGAAAHLLGIGMGIGEMQEAQAATTPTNDGKAVILYNKKYFGHDAREALLTEDVMGKEIGWHPEMTKATNPAAVIACHEYGHVVWATLLEKDSTNIAMSKAVEDNLEAAWKNSKYTASSIQTALESNKRAMGPVPPEVRRAKMEPEWRQMVNQEAVQTHMVAEAEAFAEAFLALEHGTPAAKRNPYVKAVKEIITNAEELK